MNLDNYPSFRALVKEDKPYFDEAFREYQPVISEFTFTNLFSWRNAYGIKVSFLDGFIIIRSGEAGKVSYFPPVGKNDVKSCVEKLLNDAGGQIYRAPENLKNIFDDDKRFKITFDPDNSDYLFDTGSLISLAGRKYHAKRNLISQFRSGYEYEYIPLDGNNARHCVAFEEEWCLIKDCLNVKSLSSEREAIKEMLDNFSFFGLMGLAVKINGDICAIALGEKLNTDTLVMHVLKARPDIKGLYQAVFNEFLLRHAGGFKYINLEQDLGVEGLRKTKLSYYPFGAVRKYTICLA